MASVQPEPKLPSMLLASATPTPPEFFVIDKDGEMPEGFVPSPTLLQHPKPSLSPPPGRSIPDPPVSLFPQYVVDDDIPRTGTPEPIKVTRAKKKGAGTGKKKKTYTRHTEGDDVIA